MKIILEHKDSCIASFKFDGSKISNLIEKNKNSTTTEKIESYGFNFHNESLRSKINYDVEGYDEAMDPFKNFLNSIKEDLIKNLIDNSSTRDWPIGMESSISKELYLYASPFIYRPGFFMSGHKDNRLSVAAGCFNLEDNEDVTFFTKDKEGKEKISSRCC